MDGEHQYEYIKEFMPNALGTNIIDYVEQLKIDKEKLKKELLMQRDSQQRELLKKWWKYFDEESVAVNCNDEERDEVISNFFNCD